MTHRFAALILLMIFVGNSNVAAFSQRSSRRTDERSRPRCWTDEAEIENPDVKNRRPIRLPSELATAKTRRAIMLLKLCVSETGAVARVIVVESSGNLDVDDFYLKEFSKWVFKPVERRHRRIRTVATVAVTLYQK